MVRRSPSSSHVWVIGEALIDLIVHPGLSVQAQIGGAAVNLARTVARLGAKVSYVGALSTDLFGDEIYEFLLSDGVDIERVQRSDLPTTLAVAELGAGGSPRYQFHTDKTSAANVGKIGEWEWGRGDVLVAGGLGLVLEPLATATLQALEEASRDELLTVIDVNCRVAAISDVDRYRETLLKAVGHARVVKVSVEDLDDLVALGVVTGPDRRSAAGELLQFGSSLVIITDGADATQILFAETRTNAAAGLPVSVEVPSHGVNPIDLVDTIGAGDAFLGGLLTWWILHGGPDSGAGDGEHRRELIIEAVRAAHLVAAITCCRRGADPPFAAELGDRFAR
jgi:fructokinase